MIEVRYCIIYDDFNIFTIITTIGGATRRDRKENNCNGTSSSFRVMINKSNLG